MIIVGLLNSSKISYDGVVDIAGDGASYISCKSESNSSSNVPFQIAHSLPILCPDTIRDGDVGHNFEVSNLPLPILS